MRKKRRLVQIKPDETNIHPIGQEQFIAVQNYVGDLPSDEPVDWFAQSDEYDEFPRYSQQQQNRGGNVR